MKKNYLKIRMAAVLLSLLSFRLAAQLSGVVTIDNTQPASTSNYTSFTAFATALNGQGVNGPLTVNVGASSTTYNEQVNFNVITGASSTNTITINGNGRTISFAGTSGAPHTIMLSGTDYMTINNLVIVGTGATYAMPLHLWNSADNNAFRTCTVNVPANSSSSNHYPISLSGSATNAQTSGLSNNNEIRDCVVNNGYYGITLYGNTFSPYMANNKIVNCKILDSYYMSIYTYYQTDNNIEGNLIESPTRTVFTSTRYGIYINGNELRISIDRNTVRNAFANGTTSNSYYAISLNASATVSNEIVVKNNLVSDIRCLGSLYGIYNGGYANHIYIHNTISFDDAAATGSSAYTYGIMTYGGPCLIKNNIVTCTRGGTVSKYCLYYSSNQVNSNNNVLYMNSSGGTNYIGYWGWTGQNLQTLTNWKTTTLQDAQSVDVDPVYTALFSNYAPTNLSINNSALPLGIPNDLYNANRSLAAPDPGAIEFFTTPCSGPPSTVSVITPTQTYCQGTPVNISFAVGGYTVSGLNYQWQASTQSALGPYTVVPSATLSGLTTSSLVNVTTYYSVIVSCPGAGTVNLPGAAVLMAPLTTSTVPYYESFETLNQQIKLPNCNWAVNNATTALTQTVSNTNGRIPRTGSNFAMFYASPVGVSYYYTNGIQLNAGVTYSASLWYLTEYVGYTNWTDLSILVGPNQTPTGLVPIVSTNGPAVSPIHKPLANTFTVASSGLYYVAVKATSTANSASYLSWDDLRIEIPCSLNTPSVSLYTLNTSVCADRTLAVVASGADTYTWSTGENSATLIATPGVATQGYTLWATSALSGCTGTYVQNLTVLPTPAIFASSNTDFVCAGSSANLTALGSDIVAYSWSNGVSLPATVVTPSATTTYSVIGVNSHGCSAMATKLITVNQLPTIQISTTGSQICSGESVVLTGNGAATYNWVSNTAIVYLGNPLALTPNASAVFTVTGTDLNGCSNKTMHTLDVNECTGIAKVSGVAAIKVYPNPTTGAFVVETGDNSVKHIDVIDVTGRTIISQSTNDERVSLNIASVAAGLYYVKVKTTGSTEIIKVVKK